MISFNNTVFDCLFLIYWTIVCIYACIPQYACFKKDDYGGSYCAGFGKVFSREEKIGIGIAWIVGYIVMNLSYVGIIIFWKKKSF